MDITITPSAMKALETDYMTRSGVPSALLMEHAAQGVCAALNRRIPGGKALFLCGFGNNGGDGYAAARLWQHCGGSSTVLELTSQPTGDSLMNRTLALQAGVTVLPADDAAPLPDCHCIVDAIFGTGLSRAPSGVALEIIRKANQSGKPMIAVDIPSGLDGETGCILGEAIRAAETVTFHRLKPGLLLRQGPRCAGTVTVHPILIPREYGPQEGLRVLQPADLKVIPPRSLDAHKGRFGRVVLCVGSLGMAGAAAFAANACVKAGAGLTTILCRAELIPILQVLAPGAMCLPLPAGTASAQAAARALENADAAAFGCGLGEAEDLLPAAAVFARADIPVVWDADGLNLLSRHPELLPLNPKAIATPHPGEAARLLGCPLEEITNEPLMALESLQQKLGCIVLLKGARTLMTDGRRSAANLYGSPALAKGGSGDVLTGILAALFARRLPCSALRTTQLGALIHGLAGIRAGELHGENCVTPQTLIEAIRLD